MPLLLCKLFIHPKPALSKSKIFIFTPMAKAEAISECPIIKEPSPTIAYTSLSGFANFTPKAPLTS